MSCDLSHGVSINTHVLQYHYSKQVRQDKLKTLNISQSSIKSIITTCKTYGTTINLTYENVLITHRLGKKGFKKDDKRNSKKLQRLTAEMEVLAHKRSPESGAVWKSGQKHAIA